MNMEKMRENSFIDQEDLDDAHLVGLDLNSIPVTDVDIYLQVVDIRKKSNQEGADITNFAERIEDLSDIVKKSARISANKDEIGFLGLVANKLAVLSMKLQLAQRKKAKK